MLRTAGKISASNVIASGALRAAKQSRVRAVDPGSNVETVGEGGSELKLNWGPGYRVYFGHDGKTIVILLCGGTKKRQSRDIATAKARWADYKARKAARAR